MAMVLLYHVDTVDRVNQHCRNFKADYPFEGDGLMLRELKGIFDASNEVLSKAGIPCVVSYDLGKNQYVESITFNHHGELIKEHRHFLVVDGLLEQVVDYSIWLERMSAMFPGADQRTQRGIAGCMCGEPITPDAIKYGKRHALIQILES